MQAVVVGIGNRDRGDDGIGPAVIERLRALGVAGINLVADDPSRLIDHIAGVDLAVVVDACVGLGACGTVQVVDEIPSQATPPSSHGVSIPTALELAHALGRAPKRIRFVLVEGRAFEIGAEMSPEVTAAVGPAARSVREELPMRYAVRVSGTVQGVGFRPFVYRLATSMNLAGFVANSSQGARIEVEGSRANLDEFLVRLKAVIPPPAAITALDVDEMQPAGATEFEIRRSRASGTPSAAILPDIAVCPECLRELRDATNRRHRYPFINCTHCGPRYSIVTGLPYDRPLTTMAGFEMCAECRAEYENPLDRRFHAQPIACATCGPHIELWATDGSVTATHDAALAAAADVVRLGGILALKGLGGFHFVVDARHEAAVVRLRERKRRYAKPLAVMAPDLATARELANLTHDEERLLASPEAPIVLCRARLGHLAHSVAPELQTVGLMLPYTPLHALLLEALGFPVVATSGNVSDEPICTDEHDAIERFSGIADAFLVHNRPIARPVDDSVVRVMEGRAVVLRRGRGYAPAPHGVKGIEPGILGAGAHMKSSVAISVPGAIVSGQFVGDLDHAASRVRLASEAADLISLYARQPKAVCCDLHPDYGSTRFAESLGLPVTRVQHHLAHAAACIAENDLDEPVLAVVWDGTGYGMDGTIWGGEFLLVQDDCVERVGHIRPFRLVGGDNAARDGRRSAVGLLMEAFGESWPPGAEAWAAGAFGESKLLGQLRDLLARGKGVTTTSVGRLFDGFASVFAGIHASRFEADAAMRFEALAKRRPGAVTTAPAGQDWAPLLSALLDQRKRLPASSLAYAVHAWLAESIVAFAKTQRIEAVVLSGGCFQNALLYSLTCGGLRAAGFRPYGSHRIPPNDEGVAFGQVVAASRGWRL